MSDSQVSCCCDPVGLMNNIKIEAVASWKDSQVDLPEEVKKKANFQADDKVSIISCYDNNRELCCVILRKE